MDKRDYDAVIVGSGPNGLAAGILLQQQGLAVLIVESASQPGGGMRTEELTLPGFRHDVCSAIHPLAVGSPFFSSLPLKEHGLNYIYPGVAAAHPFDDGSAAIVTKSIEGTADLLGADEAIYKRLVGDVVNDWNGIVNDILSPLRFPHRPLDMAAFGWKAFSSASHLSKKFTTRNGKALWAGMAAHSMQPLTNVATSATALVLLASAHTKGWPLPEGGAFSIAKALVSYFTTIGGRVQTGFHVTSLKQLPSSHAVLFDITPKQLLQIAGESFSSLYKRQLNNFRYGPGVFKVDWALDGPAPFSSADAGKAGTVHLGNKYEEIAAYEQSVWSEGKVEAPFVLYTQPSVFDQSRAPTGKHTAWAYCHVPNGSVRDMTNEIETQVERFAPGFRDRILAKHTFNTLQLESYNNNYIGGDISGGVLDIRQLFTRPALRWSPYRTSAKGLYICSSSAPPGGGVHGMCGYHAAKRALKDIFNIIPPKLYANK